jgi:hypothetical protein
MFGMLGIVVSLDVRGEGGELEALALRASSRSSTTISVGSAA